MTTLIAQLWRRRCQQGRRGMLLIVRFGILRRSWPASGLGSWRACPRPGPEVTAYTLSLDTPEKMEAQARVNAARPLLKIKLGTPDDMPRLEAVRRGAPEAAIIVDANEGWSAEVYQELAPHMVRLGVKMVEQPLPAGEDGMLAEIERPLPVCADESCHDRASLPDLKGKYDMVNIKLDKTGGLTEALALREAAHGRGLRDHDWVHGGHVARHGAGGACGAGGRGRRPRRAASSG